MEEIIKEKKSKSAFIIIAATLVIIIAIITVIIAKTGSPQYKLKKQLEIADRYLSELNYEQAVASYQAALEIDPMCEDAYLGMAEAYFEMGDMDAAFDILDAGIERIGSEALKARRTELEYRFGVGATHWHGGEWTDRDDILPYINDQGYMIFGAYEQDGDESNGPEPIEWEVLERNENGTFLVSRYVLVAKPYNNEENDVTWESCTLRSWLNGEFLNKTFTVAEQAAIKSSDVVNPDNPNWGTPGGNNTVDRIFLLSVDEVISHYSFNSWYDEYKIGYSMDLIIPATEYAKNQGGVACGKITEDLYNGYNDDRGSWHGLVNDNYSSDCIGRESAVWWLRSPGSDSARACVVQEYGCVGWHASYSGVTGNDGVRPALYITQ